MKTILINLRHGRIAALSGVTIVVFGATVAHAKRVALKPVIPLVIGAVRYSAPADPDLMGYVVASDSSSGREYWRRRIYRVFINPFLERDVQWVFISSLARRDDTLLITNERGKRFILDLKTRKVTERK